MQGTWDNEARSLDAIGRGANKRRAIRSGAIVRGAIKSGAIKGGAINSGAIQSAAMRQQAGAEVPTQKGERGVQHYAPKG